MRVSLPLANLFPHDKKSFLFFCSVKIDGFTCFHSTLVFSFLDVQTFNSIFCMMDSTLGAWNDCTVYSCLMDVYICENMPSADNYPACQKSYFYNG
jgi:hypothetical protein